MIFSITLKFGASEIKASSLAQQANALELQDSAVMLYKSAVQQLKPLALQNPTGQIASRYQTTLKNAADHILSALHHEKTLEHYLITATILAELQHPYALNYLIAALNCVPPKEEEELQDIVDFLEFYIENLPLIQQTFFRTNDEFSSSINHQLLVGLWELLENIFTLYPQQHQFLDLKNKLLQQHAKTIFARALQFEIKPETKHESVATAPILDLVRDFKKNNQFKKAVALCLQILNFENNKYAYLHLIQIFYALKLPEYAAKCFNQVIKIYPDFSEAYHEMGCHLTTLNPSAAIKYCTKSLELNKDLINAHYYLAEAFGNLGDYKKALEHIQIYIKHRPDKAIGFMLQAEIFLKLNNYFRAVLSYLTILKNNPADQMAASSLQALRRKLTATQLLDETKEEKTQPINTSLTLQPYKLQKFSLNDINVDDLRVLGAGGTALVYYGLWNSQPVALKQLCFESLDHNRFAFEAELQCAYKIKSPYVTSILAYCDDPYLLVLEWAPKNSLWHHAQVTELNYSDMLQIFLNIANGIKGLHDSDILHRDLKAPNILMFGKTEAKITDLALAANAKNSDATGTPNWQAPEGFEEKARATKAGDVYSLGITMWEVSHKCKQIPFPGDLNTMIQHKKRESHPPLPKDTPKKLAELIGLCCHQKPEQRPTAEAIINKLDAMLQEEKTRCNP